MNALLDGLRRAARRLAGRARRRLSGNDGGFVLLESIIAISLITVIMAAVGAEYVASVASVSRQRSAQSAAQIANSALEQVRALQPSDLIAGRGATSVTTQFAAGNAIPTVTPWLQKMDEASDPNAATTAGANATIPTCDPTPQGTAGTAQCTQKPGALAFTVSQFIGTCWLVSSGPASNCVPAAQKTSSSVSYLRVVVSVSWRGGSCTAGCYYVTSTLINADADPTFRANQPPVAAPVISGPGDQNNDIGDAVNLQLGLVTGTGVPGYAWTITSGSLPSGLSITSAGVISGVVGGSPGVQSITVQVTDGYGRTTTSAFSWSIFTAPTVITPPDQTTQINTAVNLQLTTSCANTPCTYTLNNKPTGLSISNTGLITGTPTVAGRSTTSVTIVDASGRTLTSNTFQWAVLPIASSCSTAVNLPNGGFETPTVAAGAGRNVGNGTTGVVWRTNAGNGLVEYWANGSNSTSQNGNTPITAQDGTQWIETDGSGLDTVYQDLATTPGQVLQWSLWHRARNTTNNVNARDSIQVQMGTTTQQAAQVAVGSTSPTISDGAAAWVQYTGSYTVPAGQTTTRFEVTATATSSSNSSAGNFLDAVSVTSVPCLATPATQASTVNTAITGVQLSASQGSGSYLWSGGATLPAGLTLSANGLITGTPTTVGTTNVRLILTDQLTGFQQFVTFTWTVFAAPTITTPPDQTTSVGAAVNLTVGSTCANTPCTYTASALPAGLTLNAGTGNVTGTPTTAGTTSTTITVRDNAGATATTGAFNWTIKAAPSITTPANQNTTVGVSVNLSPVVTCANTPCTYSVTALPAGLTLNTTTAAITGTPTITGSTNVTITAQDAAGSSTSATFTWTIHARPTIVSPGNQTSTVNTALILPISSTCSNTSCSYALTGAPAGLTINSSTGRITGTPTATGTSSAVKVTMTDAGGVAVDTGTFSWTITAGPSVTSPGNQSTVNNAMVSLTLIKSCPNTPCAYALNGGPAGLSISSSGVVSGTVTSAVGTLTGVTVTVTDSSGITATSAAFSWAVTAPLAGRWTFDEASGPALDSSGNSRTATLYGSAVRTSTAAQGANALNLPAGNPSAATAGSVLNTATSFTVSAWVKLSSVNATTPTQTFVSQDGASSSAFALQYRSDTGKFAFTRAASDVTPVAVTSAGSTAAPVAGQWYQLTGVSDATANTLTLYVNGVRQSTVAYSTGWNSSNSLVIGRALSASGGVEFTSGAIDDVRAYSTALSADAVAQIAQDGYWRLNEGSGTTAADSSLYGGTGTLNGGVGWTTGVNGSAAQFNGTSGAITTTSNSLDTSQSFSVVAWAKADTAAANGTVVSVDGTNVSGFSLGASGSKWTLTRLATDTTGAGATSVSATSSITAGQWYRLAAVYDSVAKTLTLYVNGAAQGTSVPFTTGFKASGWLVIGRAKSGGSATGWFGGAIDDVQALQFPLDQAGVTTLTPLTPPTPTAPTATAGSASASVSWTAPADVAGSPITGYVVTPYLAGAAQTPVTFNSTATSQTVTNLTTGGSYTFSVAAVNANGTSPTSPVSGSVLVS